MGLATMISLMTELLKNYVAGEWVEGKGAGTVLTDPVTGAMGYTYGLTGERLSMSLPGGGIWTYGYGHGDVQCLLSKDDPNSVSRSLATITDDQGRRVEMWLSEVGRSYETYTNQTFVGTNQTGCQDSVNAYDYDHLRLTSLQSTYNTLNQATNTWQSKLLVSNTYGYDLAGQRLSNQISSLDGNGNPTSRTELYSYDEQNRLKTVDYGDGQTQSYGFDAMGKRR